MKSMNTDNQTDINANDVSYGTVLSYVLST